MSWGKEWPVVPPEPPTSATAINAIWQNAQAIEIEKLNLTADKIFILTTIEDGIIKQEAIPLEKVYQNKVPTHDPYSNPDAHIYYQCACGAVLDPSTKSFAALNNAAMNSGWKVRWGHEHYKCYCVECGEGVE